MKIELIVNIPVTPQQGMMKGRILDVDRPYTTNGGENGVIVIGDTGDEVRIHANEYRIIDEAA